MKTKTTAKTPTATKTPLRRSSLPRGVVKKQSAPLKPLALMIFPTREASPREMVALLSAFVNSVEMTAEQLERCGEGLQEAFNELPAVDGIEANAILARLEGAA